MGRARVHDRDREADPGYGAPRSRVHDVREPGAIRIVPVAVVPRRGDRGVVQGHAAVNAAGFGVRRLDADAPRAAIRLPSPGPHFAPHLDRERGEPDRGEPVRRAIHAVPLGDRGQVDLEARVVLAQRTSIGGHVESLESHPRAGRIDHRRIGRAARCAPGSEAPGGDERTDGDVERPTRRPADFLRLPDHVRELDRHREGLGGGQPVEPGDLGVRVPGGHRAVHPLQPGGDRVPGDLDEGDGAIRHDHAGRPGRAHRLAAQLGDHRHAVRIQEPRNEGAEDEQGGDRCDRRHGPQVHSSMTSETSAAVRS